MCHTGSQSEDNWEESVLSSNLGGLGTKLGLPGLEAC